MNYIRTAIRRTNFHCRKAVFCDQEANTLSMITNFFGLCSSVRPRHSSRPMEKQRRINVFVYSQTENMRAPQNSGDAHALAGGDDVTPTRLDGHESRHERGRGLVAM